MSPELLHVYVIEDENHIVKIGIAGNVAKRISAINQATAYQIVNQYESPSCANARKIEKAAHEYFVDHRKKGEWFTVSFDEAVDFVKGHFVDTQLALPIERPTELSREFNGIRICQRTSDNYLDATAMCQATGKQWFDYYRLENTQAFLNALSTETGYPVSEQNQGLIQSKKGGDIKTQRTWVHPYVSINLAQWCSPKFAVMVSKWVFELMTKGHVSLNGEAPLTRAEIKSIIEAKVRDTVSNALAKFKPVEPLVLTIKLTEFETQALEQMDAWINAYIVFDPNAQTRIGRAYEDDDGNYKNTDKWLYPSYCQFCKTQNVVPISSRRFSQLLALNEQCQQHNVKRLPRASDGMKFQGLKPIDFNCPLLSFNIL
jgi:hypothetical protein